MDITLSTYINIQQTQEDLFAGWTMQLQKISDDNFAFYHYNFSPGFNYSWLRTRLL